MNKMVRNKSSYEKHGITNAFWETIVKPFIFERDGYCCRKCGSGFKLEIHSKSKKHIDASDLITLCNLCHKEEHKKRGLKENEKTRSTKQS